MIDCVLCHRSFIHRSALSFFRYAFNPYETYSHRNGMREFFCRSYLDRKYVRGITQTIRNVMDRNLNRFPLLATFLIVDWFGYLGMIIIIRAAPHFSPWLGEKLKKTFAYYPGTLSLYCANLKR
jgi:hypothetical protein